MDVLVCLADLGNFCMLFFAFFLRNFSKRFIGDVNRTATDCLNICRLLVFWL